MMQISSEHNKEERALDALMSAAFRAEDPEQPVTEEEAKRLVQNPPSLGPEDEAVMASMAPNFVDNLLRSADTGSPKSSEQAESFDREIEEAYAAMNRGREGDQLDDEARREIEKKRRELLGEPNSETGPDQEEQDGA